MQVKKHALMGAATLSGLMFVLMAGTSRANDDADLQTSRGWLVATNESAAKSGNKQPGISMEEISRRMEDKYNGRVTEIELDREWNGNVYEMEIHSTDGYEWDIEANANTGEVIKEEREQDD